MRFSYKTNLGLITETWLGKGTSPFLRLAGISDIHHQAPIKIRNALAACPPSSPPHVEICVLPATKPPHQAT